MDTNKTYLVLGDSYTIRESVGVAERAPMQTLELLRRQNIDIGNPDIVAATSWTTGDLLNARIYRDGTNDFGMLKHFSG